MIKNRYYPSILSLDVSAKCTGWVFMDSNGGISYGTIKTRKKETGERLTDFRFKLKEILDKYKPVYIILEDTVQGKFLNTNKILQRFAGVTEQTIFEYCGTNAYIISNKTVKAFFKVKTKDRLFITVIDILDWNPKRYSFNKYNDIIDAYAQLMYYCDKVLEIITYREEYDYGYRFKK